MSLKLLSCLTIFCVTIYSSFAVVSQPQASHFKPQSSSSHKRHENFHHQQFQPQSASSEQQQVIVHHEGFNDPIPYQMSLFGRDVHLERSPAGVHEQRPTVPVYVLAKMNADEGKI